MASHGSGSGSGYGSGSGSGDGYGSGSGYGDGDGDGYGRFELVRHRGLVSIGCTTLSIEEWLGERGQAMAAKHDVSATDQLFFRSQLEYWRAS